MPKAPRYTTRVRQPRDLMWMSMRMLRTFTIQDLMATAEVGYHAAQKYAAALCKAGYLRRLGRTGPHRTMCWRLFRDTGPWAPIRRRGGLVYDPNEHRTYGGDE